MPCYDVYVPNSYSSLPLQVTVQLHLLHPLLSRLGNPETCQLVLDVFTQMGLVITCQGYGHALEAHNQCFDVSGRS